jgi:hypothetical protein
LTPIKNSVFSLTGLSQTYDNPPPGENLTTPGQVSFTPDGALLLVSIKGNFNPSPPNVPFPGVFPDGRVVVFPVIGKGRLGAAVVTEFSFATGTGGPFSFVFSGPRTLVMVHVNSSTVAAYSINSNNKLTLVSNIAAPVPPTGPPHFATCWIVISGDYVYASSFDQPTGVLQIMGAPDDPPDLDGAINGFRISKNGLQNGGLTLKQIVDFAYPSPATASPPNATGNHAIDLAAIENWVYFIQPRTGMIGRLTINSRTGSLSDLNQFGGLDPGPEPWATLNPDINNFLTKCFEPNPDAATVEQCKLGSAQGITGF